MVQSGEDGRQAASLTVYNNNLGLVRETRRVTLPAGASVLRYADVAQQIRPETVYIRDAQDAAAFTVLSRTTSTTCSRRRVCWSCTSSDLSWSA